MPEFAFWQGNTALAHGALLAGCNFFGGYPITPSTEIAEVMAEELPKRGGHFIQMEDEIAGIASAIGASIAGAKALTATSGPGLLPETGESRPGLHRGNSHRGRGRHAGRALDGYADQDGTAGRHAGAMGDPRRPCDDLLFSIVGAGVL